MSVVVAEPKVEKVEYWHFVGNAGTTATYMVRIERGEKAQILHNQIDGSPIAVEILLRHDDDLNEVAGTMSFPIVNMFSYGMERSTLKTYPVGHAPVDKVVEEDMARRQESLVIRKRRVEALIGGISDLHDPDTDPLKK